MYTYFAVICVTKIHGQFLTSKAYHSRFKKSNFDNYITHFVFQTLNLNAKK